MANTRGHLGYFHGMSPASTDPTTRAIDVSIGIAHRNNRDLLHNCVKSIFDSVESASIEVIVVDNASTDGSAEAVAQAFPAIRVLRNEVPRGYGASNNQAFAASSGRYFLVLNNDTLFTPRVLETLIAFSERQPGAGCIACRILNTDGTLQHSCSYRFDLWNQIYDDLVPINLLARRSRFRSRMFHWDHNEVREVDVVLGAFMLFPREVYAQIGGFDETFEFFVEEFDICERVRRAGRRVMFTPDAVITHLGGQTFEAEPVRHYITSQQSRQRYFRKHYGAWQAYFLRATALAGVCIRLVGWGLAGLLARQRRTDARKMVAHYASVLPQLVPWGSAWRSK